MQSNSLLLVCRPHEVDALVFGHLAPLLVVPDSFTSGEFATQLRTAPGLEPLRRYIARLRSLYPLEPALLGAPCMWLSVQLFTQLFIRLMGVWVLCRVVVVLVVVRRVPLASGGTWVYCLLTRCGCMLRLQSVRCSLRTTSRCSPGGPPRTRAPCCSSEPPSSWFELCILMM